MKTNDAFWWDFEENEIIVECDNPDYPIVARFPFSDDDGEPPCQLIIDLSKSLGFEPPKTFGAAKYAIEKAEKLITDLNELNRMLANL